MLGFEHIGLFTIFKDSHRENLPVFAHVSFIRADQKSRVVEIVGAFRLFWCTEDNVHVGVRILLRKGVYHWTRNRLGIEFVSILLVCKPEIHPASTGAFRKT